MFSVKDKVTLITGGAAGLGNAIARIFVARFAKVIITDINTALGESQAEEIGCDFMPQDVTSEDEWNRLITSIETRYGALDVMINNAGIAGESVSNPETATLNSWQAIQKVNIGSVFLGCKAAIPALRRSGGGSIINLSSMGSLVPTPNNMAYGCSKAAVDHMTKSIAMHCAKNGSKIRCNSILPGVVRTPMHEQLTRVRAAELGISYEERLKQSLSSIPQGEFQEAHDIAYAALFLASDEARHITGTKMIVDGGLTMGS